MANEPSRPAFRTVAARALAAGLAVMAAMAPPCDAEDDGPLAGANGRSYPSIFQAWSGIENQPDVDELSRMARHDLVFCGPYDMRLLWASTPEQPWTGLSMQLVAFDPVRRALDPDGIESVRRRRAELRRLNPRLRLLCELRYREGMHVPPGRKPDIAAQDAFPPDSPFWLRDAAGELCPGWGTDADGDGTVERDEVLLMLLDFRRPELRDVLARKALAIQESGLFDGIMLDWWREDMATTKRWPDKQGSHLALDEERAARISLLRAIRGVVREDFLILVNSNDRTVPLSAPLVNGLFMECWKENYREGYTRDAIQRIATTLTWAESHLRQPRINCLEGWRLVDAYAGDLARRVAERDTPGNRRWMRLFTTLSLTHSDGYVVFGDDNAMPSPDHLHNWYAFWDADLGTPVGPPTVPAKADGLFIREFSRGWAVCNRSGRPQPVSVGVPTRAAGSGAVGRKHVVADMDGEILLRLTEPPRVDKDAAAGE